MSYGSNISRGLNQVMYKYPPGATFSHPRHDTIEKVTRILGEEVDLSNKEELIQRVYQRFQANEGGTRGVLEPTTTNYCIVKPELVLSEIFPRIFRCDDCGKLHDYTGRRRWDIDDLERHNGECQNCSGRLFQVHHVFLCPNCSEMRSFTYPLCQSCRDSYMYLDDEADQYKNFRWLCKSCDTQVETGTYGGFAICDICDTQMVPSVHSGSQTHRVQSFTQVDLSGADVYTASLADDEIDALILGSYFDLFDEGDTIEELAEASGGTLDKDSNEMDEEEREEVRDLARRGIISLDRSERREAIITEIDERFPDETVSPNLKNYIMLRETVELQSASDSGPSTRANDLMDKMGIQLIDVTSEFPLLAASFGYKRTFNDQEENSDPDDPLPAVRPYNMIDPADDDNWQIPIYINRTETEALLIELDPRKVAHWVYENGGDIPSMVGASKEEAREELYRAMEPVQPYEDIEVEDPRDVDDDTDADVTGYTEETVMVHRLLHSISHLLMQNAAMYSGIEETNFAEYLFPEALSVAIYAKNTEAYTAGGLYTLVNRKLSDWLRGTHDDGEKCFYDSTCANIWDGSCHACLHTGEISCQHFNMNLSRVDLYGDRLTDTERTGFWTTNWDNLGFDD